MEYGFGKRGISNLKKNNTILFLNENWMLEEI